MQKHSTQTNNQINLSCKYCSKNFSVRWPSKIRDFCSRPCHYKFRAKKRAPLRDRFFQRVQKTDTCWLWVGARYKNTGYGFLEPDKRNAKMLAHRLSYLLHYGELPADLCVCHKCDVRLCVNPEHLFLGTHAENQQDCNQKGRRPKGERHALAKLKEDQVRQIRQLIDQKYTQEKIAQMFNVSRSTIESIACGRHWQHVH